MKSALMGLIAAAATIATLAIGAPSASAQVPVGVPGGTLCTGPIAPTGVGDAGATDNQVCGAVLSFVGPDIGQVATVVEPTIIGSVVNAPLTAATGSVGNGSTGPLP